MKPAVQAALVQVARGHFARLEHDQKVVEQVREMLQANKQRLICEAFGSDATITTPDEPPTDAQSAVEQLNAAELAGDDDLVRGLLLACAHDDDLRYAIDDYEAAHDGGRVCMYMRAIAGVHAQLEQVRSAERYLPEELKGYDQSTLRKLAINA